MHTAHSHTRPARLLQSANEERCRQCPPDRVCAWACVQGTNCADIVVGAMIEQSRNWAITDRDPDQTAITEALMESFNG